MLEEWPGHIYHSDFWETLYCQVVSYFILLALVSGHVYFFTNGHLETALSFATSLVIFGNCVSFGWHWGH